MDSPLAKAHYRLAKAFGWTPGEVQQLTMAQVTLYLEYVNVDTE